MEGLILALYDVASPVGERTVSWLGEHILELFNGLSHATAGLATGKLVRKTLKYENESSLNTATDVGLAMSPDADVIMGKLKYLENVVGDHRGNLHIPYVGFAYGAVFGAVREYISKRKVNRSNLIKNAVSAGASTATHFFIDVGSGGVVSYTFGEYVKLHEFFSGNENLIYHGAVSIFFLALYTMMAYREGKAENKG